MPPLSAPHLVYTPDPRARMRSYPQLQARGHASSPAPVMHAPMGPNVHVIHRTPSIISTDSSRGTVVRQSSVVGKSKSMPAAAAVTPTARSARSAVAPAASVTPETAGTPASAPAAVPAASTPPGMLSLPSAQAFIHSDSRTAAVVQGGLVYQQMDSSPAQPRLASIETKVLELQEQVFTLTQERQWTESRLTELETLLGKWRERCVSIESMHEQLHARLLPREEKTWRRFSMSTLRNILSAPGLEKDQRMQECRVELVRQAMNTHMNKTPELPPNSPRRSSHSSLSSSSMNGPLPAFIDPEVLKLRYELVKRALGTLNETKGVLPKCISFPRRQSLRRASRASNEEGMAPGMGSPRGYAPNRTMVHVAIRANV